MKKIFSVCAIVTAILSLSSCGVPQTTSNNITETKVVLSQDNFKVVGQAYGQAKCVYILGMGGLRKKAIRANAVDEMSRNAHLTGSQTLTNVTTHSSIKMITPFYVEYICDATANIVEFK